MIGQYCN